MTIPEGAVREDESVDIYLAVLRDDKDRPKLSGLHDVVTKENNNNMCFIWVFALALLIYSTIYATPNA